MMISKFAKVNTVVVTVVFVVFVAAVESLTF